MEKAGCQKIFTDIASGAKQERKGLEEALSHVREGDTLVVWRLDRLGRSITHLIQTVSGLAQRGVGFKSLTENIDTTTSGGKLVFHIFGALAEFERDIIRERTNAGLQAARARGRKGGRPKALHPQKGSYASGAICRQSQFDRGYLQDAWDRPNDILPLYQGAQKHYPKRDIGLFDISDKQDIFDYLEIFCRSPVATWLRRPPAGSFR